MPWYAAHLILSTVFKDGLQDRYPAREDVVLIEADSPPDAFEKAKGLGKGREGDEGGTYRCDDRKATWTFVGVRKLVECEGYVDRPADGAELTYSLLEVPDRESLQRLAKGEEAAVTYRE